MIKKIDSKNKKYITKINKSLYWYKIKILYLSIYIIKLTFNLYLYIYWKNFKSRDIND